MKPYVFLGSLIVAVIISLIIAIPLKFNSQHQQIDQLCQTQFTLARAMGATDQNGFIEGKEYCLFFADYDRSMALLGEFDQKISYESKPRFIIMHNVDEEYLRYWDKQPIIYERYKKIP
jgi:hypothetical protein